jgi:hypothetical protein
LALEEVEALSAREEQLDRLIAQLHAMLKNMQADPSFAQYDPPPYPPLTLQACVCNRRGPARDFCVFEADDDCDSGAL